MSAGAGRQACPGTAARAGQSLRAGHVLRTGQLLRTGRGAQDALRPSVTRKPRLTRESRTPRERRTLRIPGAVRRRPGRLAALVRGPTGASRALMVHNVERSALLSSGRVDAELSRLTLSRVAVRRRTVRSASGRGLLAASLWHRCVRQSMLHWRHARRACTRCAFVRAVRAVRCARVVCRQRFTSTVSQQGAQGGPHQQVQAG